MRNTIWILFALAAVTTAHAQSSGTLRAAIVDERGRPVAGAQLHVDALGRSATSADQSGRLTLAGIPSGRYQGVIVVPDLAPQPIAFEISMGRVSDLGIVTIGARQQETCSTRMLFRDVSTIRTMSYEYPDETNVRSVAFHAETPCATP